MTRVIQARTEVYRGVKFDSQFELETMKTLEKYFPLGSIICHKLIEVRPASQWFPVQGWKVDFTVSKNREPILYVESKGFIHAEFKEKIKNLAYLKPDIFEKLIVVSPVISTIVRGFVSYNLKTLDNYLKTGNLNGLIADCKSKSGEP